MHLEFLIEDFSGAALLEHLLPQLISEVDHSFRVHSYRGIGRIPKGLQPTSNASRRILLDQLPRLLSGYASVPGINAVVVVMDLDNRDLTAFQAELSLLARRCGASDLSVFCVAIEEIEAWMLGDWEAVKLGYPLAKEKVHAAYIQDSICGTWETLADAIHKGGSRVLSSQPYKVIGTAKCEWASRIGPHLDLNRNSSQSFRNFRQQVIRTLGSRQI